MTSWLTVGTPSIDALREISEADNLGCSDDELAVFQNIMKGNRDGLELLAKMPDIRLPVKYPRTPGYRPEAAENAHNAWYYKCSITGAPEGLLQGKKVAIKDNVPVAGVPMMNGSVVLEGLVPDHDATVVTRLLDAGAEIVGKATCESFCFSGASFSTDFGPVRNPRNKDYVAGGSSSGSGVLVALGEADMAIGGDQGGSIRIPASNCGIVGLKPTFGLVPYSGALSIEPSLDHLGPMTKTVRDCALMLEAIAGYDPNDGRQNPFIPVKEYSKLLDEPVTDLTIGIVEEGFELSTREVQDICKKAIVHIRDHANFKELKTVRIPLHAVAGALIGPVLMDGLGTGIKGFQSPLTSDAVHRGLGAQSKDLTPTMKMAVIWGRYVRQRYGHHFYAKSRAYIQKLTEDYDEALLSCDILMMPTLTIPPDSLPDKDTPLEEFIGKTLAMIANTAVFNGTGHPALTLNAGYTAEHTLPVGLMLVGKQWEDETVLRAALNIETALAGFQKPIPTN